MKREKRLPFLGGVAKKGKRKSMNALYFRHLFQNTARGVVHTVSASGEKGEFCLCSLCSDGRPLEEEAHAGELFRLEKAVITMLLLENLHPEDLKKVGKLLKTNKVEWVLIPYGDTAENLPELSKAEKVQILKAGETVVLQEKGWNIWVKCLDHGPKGNLVLYHGPCETSKKGMDCLMAVKPAGAELPCSACVCQEDHTCGMRCCLYNDFILCKGHNGKYDGSYVLGTLLLGNADIKTKEKELREDLKPYLADLRVISMNESGCSEKVSDSFITDLGEKNRRFDQFYILPGSIEGNDGMLKTILRGGPRRIPFLTSQEAGVCISGFLKNKSEL